MEFFQGKTGRNGMRKRKLTAEKLVRTKIFRELESKAPNAKPSRDNGFDQSLAAWILKLSRGKKTIKRSLSDHSHIEEV